MTTERDVMLVAACLRGDSSAFEELVDRYQGALFHVTYGVTGSVDDAMDATQAAFVNAYEKLHTFSPTGRFFSWLYRIAINQALTLVSRRRPVAALDEAMPGTGADPETAADGKEASRMLRRALDALDPQLRTLVVLKHLEGFSYREISELLDIPEKTVKSRLFTARVRLRAMLTERGYEP